MARPYTKKSEYWSKPRSSGQTVINMPSPTPAAPIPATPFPNVEYGSTEVATAGAVPASTSSVRGAQRNNGMVDPDAFQNIRAMGLPWQGYNGNRNYVGACDAIELSTRAWMGVPVVKNAVEVSVEFSNQPLFVKSDNKTVETFFTEWFKALGMESFKQQWFRSYYREGNVFSYLFTGKFGPAYYKNFQQGFGAKNNRIPIRYELLNPSSVFVPAGLTYPYTYVRLMSTYDVARLKSPQTDQDKQVYDSLPDDVKAQIDAGGSFPMGLYVPLDPNRLRYAFYKKQDYEPLGVPMVYPVLPDIELKLAMKKMDAQLMRTIEHAILLVTTGETASEYNGGNGINPQNIARLQNLFTNQSVGRVLVADFTTKAEWLIPPIKEILGPEKYQIVNEDIAEGLQSILTGNDKFANAQIKAKIFIQRLEEGQQIFLDGFLMKEVVQVCEDMGFRTVPQVGFRKIDLQDEAVMARIVAQLGSLGILTGPEVVKALETGELPDETEMDRHQTQYKKDRDAGKFFPLVGGSQADPTTGSATPSGRPPGTGTPKVSKKVGPIGTKGAFSAKAYVDHLRAADQLESDIATALLKRFKLKELNATQIAVASALRNTIMAIHPKDQWTKVTVKESLAKLPEIPKDVADEIDAIVAEHGVDAFDAAILRQCGCVAPE